MGIGTHSGTFQADEALGVWLLRRLSRFGGSTAPVVRTRDLAALSTLPVVIDVGGVYDPEAFRFDHHQRGFFETFDGTMGSATAPDNVIGKFKTKLSACGLVYKHYGREVITTLHPKLRDSPDALEWVFERMYVDMIEGIDAIDNGIEISTGEALYKEGTGLSSRVQRLNARWNTPAGGLSEDERFEQASTLCGDDFTGVLDYIVECQLPARELVEKALLRRKEVDPAGRIVTLQSGGMPWRTHLYELERKHAAEGAVLFVLYTDQAGMWRVQAVTQEGTDFTNRLSLPDAWRGLRDLQLTEVSKIAGCRFCHLAGFIGGNDSYDGALEMARAAMRAGS